MTWLRLAIPVLLLAVLWHLADGEEAVARLRQADPLWLLTALAALHAQTVLSALRWRLISGALGQPMTPGHAVREYYLAQVVNQTLPGGVMGDGASAMRAAPSGALSVAVAAVVLERALGQVALLLVLVAGFASSLTFGRIQWPAGTLTLLLLVVAGVAIAARMLGTRFAGLRWTIARAFAPPGQKLRLMLFSLVVVALNLASFTATAYATGTSLTPEAITTLIPLILTAMLIPLSIGGWGWREGAAAALFPLAGATPEAGLVASATYGVLILTAALPGAFWLQPTLRPPAP
jgi:glycosyltransferase 2 family protein